MPKSHLEDGIWNEIKRVVEINEEAHSVTKDKG